jgi:hypothetical protein
MSQIYDFCIATDWEYDRDFLQLLQQKAHQEQGLTTYIVEPFNLKETIQKIKNQELEFNFLYDRGSDSSPEFLHLHQLLVERGVPVLDPLSRLKWASDKATMHLEFISSGLTTPYTIIIPPFSTTENLYLSVADLAQLGRPFIIKPANTTGGGIGVVNGAETLQDVLHVRKEYGDDKYLLQEKVIPLEKDQRRFWFRGFYCCGLIECAWWNDLTHLYGSLEPDEITSFQLNPLYSIVKKISELIKLNFFSTEIALNLKDNFIVIDYVNEICDMRFKSIHRDGVPDEIVHQIASQIARHVKERYRNSTSQVCQLVAI